MADESSEPGKEYGTITLKPIELTVRCSNCRRTKWCEIVKGLHMEQLEHLRYCKGYFAKPEQEPGETPWVSEHSIKRK